MNFAFSNNLIRFEIFKKCVKIRIFILFQNIKYFYYLTFFYWNYFQFYFFIYYIIWLCSKRFFYKIRSKNAIIAKKKISKNFNFDKNMHFFFNVIDRKKKLKNINLSKTLYLYFLDFKNYRFKKKKNITILIQFFSKNLTKFISN